MGYKKHGTPMYDSVLLPSGEIVSRWERKENGHTTRIKRVKAGSKGTGRSKI
jgi:hypothetical protein